METDPLVALTPESSFPRKRESRGGGAAHTLRPPPHPAWIPAFAGMTEGRE